VQDEHGARRLDDREDWVRQEIETALASEKLVLPVMVDGAPVLTKDALRLVPSLQPFTELQSCSLRPAPADWKTDVDALVVQIEAQKLHRSATKKSIYRPTAAVSEEINPSRPYILSHLSLPSLRREASRKLWDVSVYVDVYTSVPEERRALLEPIERVVYQLHKTFRPPVITMRDWRDGFHLDLRAWDEFWMKATVYFKEAEKAPIEMVRYVTLYETEPLR
jgi:hypothetical protein